MTFSRSLIFNKHSSQILSFLSSYSLKMSLILLNIPKQIMKGRHNLGHKDLHYV